MGPEGTKPTITERELADVVEKARVILDEIHKDHPTGFTTREFAAAYGLDPDKTACMRKSRVILRRLKQAGVLRSQKVIRENVHGDENTIYGWAIV
jgi:hypothetical protein